MNSVSLTYKAEDESHGELAAKLRCGEFSGRGSAWFNISQVEEFAQSIGRYPIEADSAPLLESGFWKDDGTLDQVHFRIQIKPIGQRGMLSASVQLAATEMSTGVSSEIRVEFPVIYGDLARFQSSLLSHLNGQATEAILEQSLS
ncbi:hypothetical protein [Pararhizobium polonicum]|nr:hypothetical protein [Pararhizobium polonicum]